jgi:hypothetical protein
MGAGAERNGTGESGYARDVGEEAQQSGRRRTSAADAGGEGEAMSDASKHNGRRCAGKRLGSRASPRFADAFGARDDCASAAEAERRRRGFVPRVDGACYVHLVCMNAVGFDPDDNCRRINGMVESVR